MESLFHKINKAVESTSPIKGVTFRKARQHNKNPIRKKNKASGQKLKQGPSTTRRSPHEKKSVKQRKGDKKNTKSTKTEKL